MGKIGLTEVQKKRIAELELRENSSEKPLTEKMKAELSDLREKQNDASLPEMCRTHLMEWYAGEPQSVYSKYIDKGNMSEPECIGFMANVLDFGIAQKNQQTFENDFMVGTPDVIFPECVVDVKSPWDILNLHSNIYGMNYEYRWQLLGYMVLTRKNRAILFYGLMDTDESVNFGEDVIYSDLPDNQRWIAYEIRRSESEIQDLENVIRQRVELCREWLKRYDGLVKSKMGKINID